MLKILINSNINSIYINETSELENINIINKNRL